MSDIMEINKEFQNKNRTQNKEEAEWFRLANLDKAREELEQARSAYQTQKDALSAKHEKELEQARNNTLKDEYGQEIPIAMVKKPFGMRQEKAPERVARLTGIANARHEKELRRLDFRLQRAQEKVAYYENEDIINRISDDELTDSYSEKRRKLLKNYLLMNVESDRGKLFSPEEEEKRAAFTAFLDAAAAYAQFDAQMVVERVRDKKSLLQLNEDTEEREAEITRYQDMLKKLALLKNAAGKDAALLKMAESYENLLSGIADGDLKVPRDKREQVIDKNILMTDKAVADPEKNQGILETAEAKDVPLFAHEPSVNDIVQGMLGDCYLVSALGAIVDVEPQAIKNAMRDNHDGTVTVRFFQTLFDKDWKAVRRPRYYRVPKVRIKEKGGRGALWVNAMEIAFGAFKKEETEKAAIFNHFEQVLPEEEKALFTAERDRIKKEIDDYFDKKMPGEKYKKEIVDENFKEVNRWTYLQRMEQVVKKNKKWKELYESNVLSSHLEKVDMQTLHGGMSADATTAITGNLTETSILAGTLRDKNQLNLFMDDMLANYMEKHYNEWSKTSERPDDGSLRETEDLAKGFLHAILEQREPKHKSKEKGFFTGIITREEIGDVLSEAIADTGEAYLQSEGFKEANELFDNWLKKENKQAVFARLEAKYGRDALYETMRDMAVGMLRYAADHKEENTNMDYERFSGSYSVPARKEFEKIKKALTERRSVVAGTARLEKADGSREGTSGEPLFDGIASLHAYMVVGTRTEQRDGKEILYVRVRNPWSGYGVRYVENEDGSVSAEQDASDITKGESEMELNDFFTRVRRVTYGKVA